VCGDVGAEWEARQRVRDRRVLLIGRGGGVRVLVFGSRGIGSTVLRAVAFVLEMPLLWSEREE